MELIEELRFMGGSLPKRTLKTKREEIRARLFGEPYTCYDPGSSEGDSGCEVRGYYYKGKFFITSCRYFTPKQSDGQPT